MAHAFRFASGAHTQPGPRASSWTWRGGPRRSATRRSCCRITSANSILPSDLRLQRSLRRRQADGDRWTGLLEQLPASGAVGASRRPPSTFCPMGEWRSGIGAGYSLPEYGQTGIPLPPPGIRVEQLRESIAIVKGLSGAGPFARVSTVSTTTSPRWMVGQSRCSSQRPPIQVGGGRKSMLALAGREADIVGIIARSLRSGGLDFAEDTHEAVAQKVSWVRDAAGDRFAQLELGLLVWGVEVTGHRRSAAERMAQLWGLTVDQVLNFALLPARRRGRDRRSGARPARASSGSAT